MTETIPFPTPFKENGRNYWTKGAFRRWRAQRAGLPEPTPQPDDDDWLTSRQVRDMLGGVSHMWLYRRLSNGSSPRAA